jgi:hypothetical protein
MEKISWTDRVRNEKVKQRVTGVDSMLRKMTHRKLNWIDPTLNTNCLLKHLVEGTGRKIERNGREDQDEEVRSFWMTLRKKTNIRS